MTTYLVATLARYVLVEAEDETQARELGHAALYDLYADLRKQYGREVPVEIRTVREATRDEIELWNWHHKTLKAETIPRRGDRIRLLEMRNDADTIPAGQVGTVLAVRHCEQDTWLQIDVAWDNGRTLMLVVPPDRYELIAANN